MGIVRARFDPQPQRFGQWPNKPTTIDLLESGFVTKRSISLNVNHNRLAGVRMTKANKLKGKTLLGQVRG